MMEHRLGMNAPTALDQHGEVRRRTVENVDHRLVVADDHRNLALLRQVLGALDGDLNACERSNESVCAVLAAVLVEEAGSKL